jgi:hypothetical protein
MSDNWIALIPADPRFVPDAAKQREARDRFADNFFCPKLGHSFGKMCLLSAKLPGCGQSGRSLISDS